MPLLKSLKTLRQTPSAIQFWHLHHIPNPPKNPFANCKTATASHPKTKAELNNSRRLNCSQAPIWNEKGQKRFYEEKPNSFIPDFWIVAVFDHKNHERLFLAFCCLLTLTRMYFKVKKELPVIRNCKLPARGTN